MFGAILLTVLPALLFYILLPKFGFKIKSHYLRISLSWFTGMYIATIFSFLLAIVLSNFTNAVLFKATLLTLILVTTALFFFWKDIIALKNKVFYKIRSNDLYNIADTTIICACLFFSILFFSVQLGYHDSAIYRSPIYWDFHWHAGLIQNFAYGDNFPPQNEAFAGVTHTYHYFWGVITAMYEVLGLSLVAAINVISILTFFFLLMTIIGLSEEFFRSKSIGVLAVILTLTSSSGHVLDYFAKSNAAIIDTIKDIFTNTSHPFYFSIFKKGSFTYNGTMFNLFYFLEERQLIFSVVYLLICCWIIFERKKFSTPVLLITGSLMGAYFLWHLYVTLMILWLLLFILILDKDKKATLLLLAGFCTIFGLHYLYFKQVTHSSWFLPDIANYPKLNFGFSDQDNKPFSFMHAYLWYAYSYGLKFILFPIGLAFLWFSNKRLALLIIGIVLPTFLALNSLQISFTDVYENHKWLRPMNIIVDVTVAFFIYEMLFKNFQKRSRYIKSIGVIVLVSLTASGIIELMPFINSRPTSFYAYYPSDLILKIRNTPPKATFMGSSAYSIQLAGRKLFLGNTLASDLKLNKQKRKQIANSIYESKNLLNICLTTKKYGIDYVQFDTRQPAGFETLDDSGKRIFFLNVRKACPY